VTDLAGTQLSNLLETLPGIAKVLRSPVADAIVSLIKAASGQAPFNPAEVDELMKFAVRRNLITADEGDQVLLEARNAIAGIMPPPAKPKPPAAPVAPVTVRAVHPMRPTKPPVKRPAKAAPPVKAKAAAKKAKPARHAKPSRPLHKKPVRKK